MKPLMVGLCALGIWSAVADQAHAAWNNVFQPTLFGRKSTTSNSVVAPAVVYSSPVIAAAPACSTCNSPPPAPAPSCAPSCSTSYTQRCYYQPVTTFETKTFYEPVTTFKTSFYYEPVVSYRLSCYYDPCSCSVQQVATPVTSYALRSQTCPVQSWVQRCAQVPVTSYQKSCFWQPQTTCCQTTVGALIPAGATAPVAAPAPSTPPVIGAQTMPSAPPNVTATPSPSNPPNITTTPSPNAPPSIGEQHEGDKRFYPQSQPQRPNTGVPTSPWQPSLGAPIFPSTTPTPPPPVKLDRIVVGPAGVEGQVLRSDNTPRPGAQVTFVSGSELQAQRTVTANSAGRFQAHLTPGAWNVYLQNPDGTTNFSTRIDIAQTPTGSMTLVSR